MWWLSYLAQSHVEKKWPIINCTYFHYVQSDLPLNWKRVPLKFESTLLASWTSYERISLSFLQPKHALQKSFESENFFDDIFRYLTTTNDSFLPIYWNVFSDIQINIRLSVFLDTINPYSIISHIILNFRAYLFLCCQKIFIDAVPNKTGTNLTMDRTYSCL